MMMSYFDIHKRLLYPKSNTNYLNLKYQVKYLPLSKIEMSMIQSMTGYGQATVDLHDKKIVIEIHSFNNKHFDLNIHIPQHYKHKEIVVRNLLKKKLHRGKIDLIMKKVSGYSLEENMVINTHLTTQYLQQIREFSDEAALEAKEILPIILQLPGVWEKTTTEWKEKEWEELECTILRSIEDLIKFRKQEGKVLETSLLIQVEKIEKLLTQITPFENERIELVRKRIKSKLLDARLAVEENRFEQELIYYFEKLDFTEEKVRLKSHCQYFKETCKNKDIIKGKKLGFISQEMGREINTLGSKAQYAMIQQLIVKMKDEHEKIKEQLLNVL